MLLLTYENKVSHPKSTYSELLPSLSIKFIIDMNFLSVLALGIALIACIVSTAQAGGDKSAKTTVSIVIQAN